MNMNLLVHLLAMLLLSRKGDSLATLTSKPLYLGIDYGTSGVRTCLIDADLTIHHENNIAWSPATSCSCIGSGVESSERDVKNGIFKADCPVSWKAALYQLISDIPADKKENLSRICISGTSSTALIYDTKLKIPTRSTRLYNFNILDPTNYIKPETAMGNADRVMKHIKTSCPSGSATDSSSSTLAKLLMWHFETPLSSTEHLAHQSDFCASLLLDDSAGFRSDWHNALKLGFDVETLTYPPWLYSMLEEVGIDGKTQLPVVVEPGESVGLISPAAAKELGLNPWCVVGAGTTDSIAAFIASGAERVGQAVTSLGSTMAIKAISEKPVQDSSRGVYSHRVGDKWLVGGASNVGCAVLRQEGFSNQELVDLSVKIDPQTDVDLDYYPLCKPGERFPVNDPLKAPCLDPKPLVRVEGRETVDRGRYLHGLLQSMARIERQGFKALTDLGASPVTEVFTAGGGARNPQWTELRTRVIGIPCLRAINVEAAFGAARLGMKGEKGFG